MIQRRGSRGPPYGWTDGPSFCVLQHFSQVEYVSAVRGEGGREGEPSIIKARKQSEKCTYDDDEDEDDVRGGS